MDNINPDSLNLMQSALWYASMGWEVFPLKPRSKYPFKNFSWPSRASSDPKKIMYWWGKQPNANIGLHPGPSGLIVVDLDRYKEGGADLAIADQRTVTSLTGGGGQHLIYRLPADRHYGNRRGKLPDNIDIRCYNGYVILPPSVHPGGGRYEWEGGYSPADIEPAALPAELVDILDNADTTDLPAVEFRDASLPDLLRLRVSDDVRYYIKHGHPAGADRSQIDHIVVFSLVAAGLTNGEIEAIFAAYPIGARYLEKADHGQRYLGYSIAKARATVVPRGEYVPHKDRVAGARARNYGTEVKLVEDALGFVPAGSRQFVFSTLASSLYPSSLPRLLAGWAGEEDQSLIRRELALIEPGEHQFCLEDFYSLAEANGWQQGDAEMRIAQQRLFGA